MIHFTPTVDFPMQTPNIQGKLFDFVEACRIAEAKLALVSECVDATEDGIIAAHVDNVQATAKLHARIWQELVNGAPTVPDRVFRAIRTHENHIPWNVAHIESAILALTLAQRSLCEAKELSCEISMEIDDAWRLMIAADFAIGLGLDLLEGHYVSEFDSGVFLTGLLLGMPVPTMAEARAKRIAVYESFLDSHPDGDDYMTAEEAQDRLRQLQDQAAPSLCPA